MVETWSLLVTTATLAASVIGYVVLRVIESRRARDAAQRAAVSRVLDTVERASRALASSSISGIWTNHVFELTQVLPRLLLELHPRDQAIAVWVYREIQTLVVAQGRRHSARIIYGIGYTLTEWKNGHKSRAWFVNDLAENPPGQNFVVPRSTRVRLNARPIVAPRVHRRLVVTRSLSATGVWCES